MECSLSNTKEDYYFYSIAFKEDSGVFIYFKYFDNDCYYPVIFFKNYNKNNNSFENYFNETNEIKLDKYLFLTGYKMNNLIKISDYKLGFFTGSYNSEILYVIIINIFVIDNNKFKIMYYSIEINKFFNFTIFKDIRGHIFNDFIILGTDYCLDISCDNENNNNYYSSLMIIGYPNSNDSELDIINYLLLDNNNTINNLIYNLSENLVIDNNIFGYIYKGIKIKNINKTGNIYLVSSLTNEEVEKKNELNKNENVKIEFRNKNYSKSEYILEYSFIVTEEEYEEYEKYPINITTIYGNDSKEIFNKERKEYIGKSIYFNIFLRENLLIDCGNINCSLCFEKNFTCITSKPYMEINTIPTDSSEIFIDDKSEENDNNKSKTNNDEVIISESTEREVKKEDNTNDIFQLELINISICINEEIINDKCSNEEIKEDQIKIIYYYLLSKVNSNITNIIIKTKNVIFQLSTLDMQKNLNDNTISSIDFGECEDLLKNKSKNQLKILKEDIKSDDLSSTYVLYEIYDSSKREKIDLDICKDIQIKVNVPKILDNETLSMYYNLFNLGYNIFNLNDSFYNDVCSTYT